MLAVVEPLWAAIAGAVVGGALSLGAAEWAFRRARAAAAADERRRELSLLEGVLLEVEAAMELAARASPTMLPIDYLNQAMPLRAHMNPEERVAFRTYTQAVLRYNGRVTRIIAYGMGKRAAGESPGSEKPIDHAEEVREAGVFALERLDGLRRRLDARSAG